MKKSTVITKVIGSLSVILIAQLFSFEAQAFGRARAPASEPIPSVTPAPTQAPSLPGPVKPPQTPAPISSSCVSTDANHICMGLKMVSYTRNNVPVVTEEQANALLAGINKVWGQCNIAFQLEKYEYVDPATRGLSYDTNWRNDGDTVRSNFNDSSTFLVVSVGSLTGATIAVTEMPGTGIYGVLVEDQYANNPLTVGHELGHYQGLYHVSSTANLMSAYIGPNTEALNADQCATARSTDFANWQVMMRH